MDQSNPSKRINLLARKWQEGNITEEERKEFEKWYNGFDNVLEISTGESRATMEQRLYLQIARKGNINLKRASKWPRYAAAATILLVLGLGGYNFIKRDNLKPTAQVLSQDVAPGSTKAILTLANGESILLNDIKKGHVAVQGNAKVKKTSDGNLIYEATDNGFSSSSTSVFNTIRTPFGGEFHLTLSDGTKVWLNAGSSIKYPTNFTGAERKVEITGEVYFEVTRYPGKPFRVTAPHQVVEVLGTDFNVNAYADEAAIRTTLLEGSIKVIGFNNSKIIKPGQQTVVTGQSLVIDHADIDEAVAWKDGYFRFNDEKIESLMRKLSRWYNIEVTFKGPVSEEAFHGKISREKNISQVLKMLEKTNAVHFQIEGRRVIVTQ